MSLPSLRNALFISDLHLDVTRPDITDAFVHFLQDKAPDYQALFILGDLFEVWLGDDAPNPLADSVASELRKLSDKGVAIFLMHGNRDFLIGDEFASRCNASLTQEPYLLTLQASDNSSDKAIYALAHGDALCIDDLGYMQFRDLVRNPDWQADFLSKSLAERIAFAKHARAQSKQDTADKADEIMDVNQAEVEKLLLKLQVPTLIHGHTHRPNTHQLRIQATANESINAERIVLGDWDNKVWYVTADHKGASLLSYPL